MKITSESEIYLRTIQTLLSSGGAGRATFLHYYPSETNKGCEGSEMGQCSGRLGGGRTGDVLGSTVWAREVVTGYQRKRRGIQQLTFLRTEIVLAFIDSDIHITLVLS